MEKMEIVKKMDKMKRTDKMKKIEKKEKMEKMEKIEEDAPCTMHQAPSTKHHTPFTLHYALCCAPLIDGNIWKMLPELLRFPLHLLIKCLL